MEKKEYLKVKIFWFPTTKEVFYEGEAESVSSQNQLGKFDVLPKHTNFITLIFNELSLVTSRGEKISFNFKRGVLEVRKNRVKIFLGL